MSNKRLVTFSREPGRAFVVKGPGELDCEIGVYHFACDWWGMVPAQQWLNELHAHINLEIGYVSEGEGEMVAGGRQYRLNRGDVFISLPGEEHSLQSAPGKSLGLQFVSYDLTLRPRKGGEAVIERKIYGGLVRRFLGCRDRVRVDGSGGEVGALFEVIRREMEGNLHGWEHVVRAASRALILGSARLFAPSAAPQVPLGRGEWTWIDWSTMRAEAAHSRAFSYLSGHIADDVRVEEVAKHVGTSVRNLQRILGKWGVNFRGLLHEWRLKKAKFLLVGTDLPVGRISREIGISNTSHFISAFRRKFGLSPKKFRNLRES